MSPQPKRDRDAGDAEPERMDAPNQQAVGMGHPSEEGTGGKPAKDAPAPADQPVSEPPEPEPEPGSETSTTTTRKRGG